jgi:electron transport complex protein RnfB
MPALIDTINALLPQTQCERCGHPGCKPYAQAIAEGEAINRCPPGGNVTITALAQLLGVPVLPLDPEHGIEDVRKVAVIREAECIGCTKCIQACPVDAILGSAQRMHSVIASECTGCDLCLEPCPVDCIDMVARDAALLDREEMRRRAVHYKARYDFRNARKAEEAATEEHRRAALAAQKHATAPLDAKAEIAAALARVKAKKAQQQPDPPQPSKPEQDQQ